MPTASHLACTPGHTCTQVQWLIAKDACDKGVETVQQVLELELDI